MEPLPTSIQFHAICALAPSTSDRQTVEPYFGPWSTRWLLKRVATCTKRGVLSQFACQNTSGRSRALDEAGTSGTVLEGDLASMEEVW